jgi:hypothetical protein
MGIALNLQIAFGSIAIFTILILPIHEHGVFNLFLHGLTVFIVEVLYLLMKFIFWGSYEW